MPCAEQRVRFPRRGGSQKPPHPSEPCVLPCAKGSNPPGKPSSDRSAVFPSHASSSGCSASSVKVENVIFSRCGSYSKYDSRLFLVARRPVNHIRDFQQHNKELRRKAQRPRRTNATFRLFAGAHRMQRFVSPLFRIDWIFFRFLYRPFCFNRVIL